MGRILGTGKYASHDSRVQDCSFNAWTRSGAECVTDACVAAPFKKVVVANIASSRSTLGTPLAPSPAPTVLLAAADVIAFFASLTNGRKSVPT